MRDDPDTEADLKCILRGSVQLLGEGVGGNGLLNVSCGGYSTGGSGGGGNTGRPALLVLLPDRDLGRVTDLELPLTGFITNGTM